MKASELIEFLQFRIEEFPDVCVEVYRRNSSYTILPLRVDAIRIDLSTDLMSPRKVTKVALVIL